jgi:macrolide transport system ATP-binding/permease protein
MKDLSIQFQHLSFRYEGAAEPLFHDLSVHFTRGWTGIVGANGAGKTTILKLAAGILQPTTGTARIAGSAIYCEQRTDDLPDRLDDLVRAPDGNSIRLRDRLGIEADWLGRWPTLSHGERKRAQVAVALWQEPEVLSLDEPTNHLDSKAQELLFEALSTFRGVGLLVSHDRRLLDGLCHQCLFVEWPVPTFRPGGYTQASLQAELDETSARRANAAARQELEKLNLEAIRRKHEAAQADRKRSKRGIGWKDHDAKGKIDLARVSGKDGAAGRRFRQLQARVAQAQGRVDGIQVKKQYELGIWMPGSKSHRNVLFNIPSGSLSLGEGRRLTFPPLIMAPDDRIALTGLNGTGKSTLIRTILGSVNVSKDRLVYIPQEIDIRSSQEILKEARNLSHEKLGRMMIIVSRLGSVAQRLLETQEPSPGEIRKMILATGIANEPHLIIMDEPTNHLDLPSIRCLEDALLDCPCGLLLVSHDKRFLDTLTKRQWHISGDEGGGGNFVLKTD